MEDDIKKQVNNKQGITKKYALCLIDIKNLGTRTFSYLIPEKMKETIRIGQAVSAAQLIGVCPHLTARHIENAAWYCIPESTVLPECEEIDQHLHIQSGIDFQGREGFLSGLIINDT